MLSDISGHSMISLNVLNRTFDDILKRPQQDTGGRSGTFDDIFKRPQYEAIGKVRTSGDLSRVCSFFLVSFLASPVAVTGAFLAHA